MKGFLFSISLLLGVSGFTQTEEKPMYYMDVNGDYISKNIFQDKSHNGNKKDGHTYMILRFENDSSLLSMLYPKKKMGKLFSKEKQILYSYLDSLNKKSIDRSKFIIIKWYPGKDPCNSSGTINSGSYLPHKRYLRKLKKRFNHETLLVYKNDENLFKHQKMNWLHDDKRIIENLFFKYHFPCGSFVVIAPSGNFIARYSEYSNDEILDICEEIKDSKK